MSLLPWPFSRSTPEESERTHSIPTSTNPSENPLDASRDGTNLVPLSFDDVAQRFDELNLEVAKLQQQITAQQSQIKQYVAQLQGAQTQNRQHETTIRDLRKNVQQERGSVAILQKAICPSPEKLGNTKKKGPTSAYVDELNAQRKARNKEIAALQNTLNGLRNEKDALQRHQTTTKACLDEALATNRDLQLDLEYVKCTAAPTASHSQVQAVDPAVPLPDAPFILVIIDGDFYHFKTMPSKENSSDSQPHPATQVARSIKNNLHKYIDDHGLPPHCRLLVRVLMNVSGSRPGRNINPVKRNGKTLSPFEDFRITFTEFSPLFEFLDAGFGKERVDSKIHELYHTFVPNKSCHKIFLAVTHDNGFARTLEQYIDHPVARTKTCLISAGYVATEIASLNLETIEWPSVFAQKHKPFRSVKKDSAREAALRKQELGAQKQRLELIERHGQQGYDDLMRDQVIARVTKELTGSKDHKEILQGLMRHERRRDGVRASAWFAAAGSPGASTDGQDDADGDEFVVEDGVD